jgi:hypothetical protein
MEFEMPNSSPSVCVLSLMTTLALVGVSVPAVAQRAQRGGPARAEMERCLDRALSELARADAPQERAGPTVLSRCDRQLRATLQESIRNGEAGNCTVDSCLALVRSRTARDVTAAYRQTFLRR